MIGREIDFTELILFNLPTGETHKSLLEIARNSIVIYVDSSSCVDCSITNTLNIRGYELELKQKQREDIPFIYIFNTQDVWTLQNRLHELGFYHYYFVDFENIFLKKNQIPENSLFHTFLLKNDKVRLIGNPSSNFKIKALYNRELKMPTRR